jgi:cytoskeleton protein RodZ
MNDDTSRAANEPAGPVAGERLAEARRLRQMSLPDIARELHIDEIKVQALEENKFEVLGAPVFAKGHLRKYAEIVGVPIDDVMADYYALNRSAGAPPIVGPPRKRPRDVNLAPWLLLIPVLLAAAAVYWWLNRPAIPEPTVVQPAATTPAPQSPPPDIRPEPASRDDRPVETAEPAVAAPLPVTENAAPAAREPAAAEPQAPAGNEVALRLVFSGDCWTEITAGDGRRLFVDLGKAGRTLNLTGVAPVRVLLGNANNVALTVNGEPYRIAERERRGDTARLTINR